jgi:hypothetical protein
MAVGVSTGSAALSLWDRAALGVSHCQTGKGWSSKSVNCEHTCSTFFLPFTLYRSTKPVADSDESGHLFQSISDTVPGLSDSCRSEATL